jgi:hypothetical protein
MIGVTPPKLSSLAALDGELPGYERADEEHDWKTGSRIGEAGNPGPDPPRSIEDMGFVTAAELSEEELEALLEMKRGPRGPTARPEPSAPPKSDVDMQELVTLVRSVSDSLAVLGSRVGQLEHRGPYPPIAAPGRERLINMPGASDGSLARAQEIAGRRPGSSAVRLGEGVADQVDAELSGSQRGASSEGPIARMIGELTQALGSVSSEGPSGGAGGISRYHRAQAEYKSNPRKRIEHYETVLQHADLETAEKYLHQCTNVTREKCILYPSTLAARALDRLRFGDAETAHGILIGLVMYYEQMSLLGPSHAEFAFRLSLEDLPLPARKMQVDGKEIPLSRGFDPKKLPSGQGAMAASVEPAVLDSAIRYEKGFDVLFKSLQEKDRKDA